MSQTKAQLIQPVGIFTAPGVNVSGTLTATTFSGNLTGNAQSLAGTPNLNVGVLTATTFYGSGSGLSGVAAAGYVGQTTTSQSGTTTINLSLGNVVYFTHNTDTTVAFANTSSVQEVRFIRVKDDTATERAITWPASIIWNGGSAPTLINSAQDGDAQIFNLTTRDSGVTWYGYEEFSYSPVLSYKLFSWGSGTSGRLALNNNTNYSSPRQIPGTQWTYISMNGGAAAAKKSDKTLWAWGSGGNGQLASNDAVTRSSPIQIPGTQWNIIEAGLYTSFSIKNDGTLWAWGYNYYGMLGNNTSGSTSSSSPIQIPGTQWSSVSGRTGSSNASHAAATKSDGTLWIWGGNGSGNLGLNNAVPRSSPHQIPGTQWSSIFTGGNGGGESNTAAIKSDGTLWEWGINSSGELGFNDGVARYSSPRQIPGTQWSKVSLGTYWTLAIKNDSSLWVWGNNSQGELSQNNTVPYSSPRQIPGTQWSTNFVAGGSNALATKTDYSLWAWGSNSQGGLSQNNTVPYSSPTQLPGTQWSSIVSGNYQSLFALQSL
jgi:alpha-tubulin suppressor-like RCC1 family protein